MQFNSIRLRLTVLVVLMATVPLLLAGLAIGLRTYNAQEQQALELQSEVSLRVANDTQGFILERVNELETVASIQNLDRIEENELQSVLQEILSIEEGFDEIAILNADGQEIARVSRLEIVGVNDLIDQSQSEAYRVPVETQSSYYGPVEVDDLNGELTMTIGIGLVNLRTGDVGRIIIADLRLSQVGELLRSIEASDNIYLVDENNRVVAHENPSIVLGNTTFDVPSEDGLTDGLDGESVALAFTNIELGDQSIAVVAEKPASEALELAVNTSYIIIGFIVAFLLISIAVGYLAVQVFINPLSNLAEVAQNIEAGDLKQRAPESDLEEISTLSNAFNSMTSRLRANLEGLEQVVSERTRDLTVAVDVSQQMTSLLTVDELLNEVTKQTRQAFDLYAIGLFLPSTDKQQVFVLKAGDGDYAGGKLPTFVIDVNSEKSLIAESIRSKKNVIVQDTEADERYLYTDYLPATKSEMAIPLVRGDQVIGVMDLQSNSTDRFDESTERVMMIIARQLTVAIENAQFVEEQVQVAEELRLLDKLKSQFLASMSHELRTPLNAIINFTQFVSSGTFGEINERQEETLDKVLISGHHLLSLINDILDFSKIEAGMLQLFMQDVKLQDILKRVRTTVGGLEIPDDVQLEYDIADDLPETITGDKRRVTQILINLMSNAVKFTDTGSVKLKAWHDNGSLCFTVTDTGSGISDDHLETIFEPFQQTELGQVKGTGTGLGLPISRHLAEAHGGKLWVESTVDKGSTFYVTIPVGEIANGE